MDTKPILHPSCFIDTRLTDAIRHFAPEAERMGRLHPQQLAISYEEKWFNLFVPEKYGGLALPFPDGLRIEESLAWADGSTGWTVTLCSGANWFIGFMEPETAEIVFNTSRVCLAGSGRPSGTARMVEEEYEITGCWHYATGAAHATAFTANCIIEKDGIILQKEDGSPLIASFVFLSEEVTVDEDWNCFGMIATSSHSFQVKNLRLKKNRCFSINEKTPIPGDPVYQYPFMQFAEATLAVNISGMGVRFLDLFETIVKERTSGKNYSKETIAGLYTRLLQARKQVEEKRQLFYHSVGQSWEEISERNLFSSVTLEQVSKTSRELAATARKLADDVYPYCGLMAANRDSEINRVWRNLHTASQHPLLLY